MNRYSRLIACAVVLMMALGLLAACAEAPARAGAQAPDFELTTLEGETFRLSDHRGKAVYVNIWATWCPPCVGEMPDIQKLADAHPDELVVIGASIDEKQEDVEAFVAENGITYPIAMDEGGLLALTLFPTMYIPESIFISPDGIVTDMGVGGMSYEQMEACFRKALGN